MISKILITNPKNLTAATEALTNLYQPTTNVGWNYKIQAREVQLLKQI
jgi:hypothetical protein